jgi:hypothetical protein
MDPQGAAKPRFEAMADISMAIEGKSHCRVGQWWLMLVVVCCGVCFVLWLVIEYCTLPIF